MHLDISSCRFLSVNRWTFLNAAQSHTLTHTHTHKYTYVYIYIYIYDAQCTRSSSNTRLTRTTLARHLTVASVCGGQHWSGPPLFWIGKSVATSVLILLLIPSRFSMRSSEYTYVYIYIYIYIYSLIFSDTDNTIPTNASFAHLHYHLHTHTHIHALTPPGMVNRMRDLKMRWRLCPGYVADHALEQRTFGDFPDKNIDGIWLLRSGWHAVCVP